MARKQEQKNPSLSDNAGRMYNLFTGNTRGHGLFIVATGRTVTEHRGLVVEDIMKHLRGERSVGPIPILDDDSCHFAAIDIDNHGHEEDIPIGPIDAKIAEAKLPLIACRTKSGGVHVYFFLEKPQPALRVKSLMARWNAQLDFDRFDVRGRTEIFPKQGKLATTKDGTKQLGNYINLPYFAAEETQRYAFRGGRKLSLEEFLAAAERMRVDDTGFRVLLSADHSEAPPCVQKMFQQGVASGYRNEALYSITVYFRKADPSNVETRALDANATIFQKPLARAEAARTITSAARPDYKYRCNEEPNRSLCDREACVKRKFGISRDEHELLLAKDALPLFRELRRYATEPVRWELLINDVRVSNIATDDLLDFKRVRQLIAERLTKVVPLIKNVEWERILQPLMDSAVVVEAPDDASVTGVIRSRLIEFASKTELNKKDTPVKERVALVRGLPIVIQQDGEACVAFRAQDFIAFLKRTKSEELKGTNLWFAVKELGVGHTKVRAGDHNMNVWYMPVEEILKEKHEAEKVQFKPGL